jgi:pyruvate/2-oxoglutarate dehydrogenase complex dihydrolipoamide dehydrogenase (E3) component
VGLNEKELQKKNITYDTIKVKYADYGAAIAENSAEGFVKVFTSPLGHVYGVSIVGQGSGEMINEWALVIHRRIRLLSLLFLPHSFPTMGFLSKRIAEQWMMKKMNSDRLTGLLKFMFRKM